MFTISNTREIYKEVIPTIIDSEESWKDFLMFSSNLYTRNFENASLIYAQNSTTTMVATYDEWKNVNRFVKKGTKGIAIIKDNYGRPMIDYVFDIADTKGFKIPERWQFKIEKEESVLNKLDNKEYVGSLQEYISNAVGESLHSEKNNYMETISELCYYSGNKIEDNPEWLYRLQNVIKNSAEYLTACRCGVKMDSYGELHPGMSMLNARLLVFTLCDITLKVAKNVLNNIARAVTKVELEERGFEYDKRMHIVSRNERNLLPEDNTVGRSEFRTITINGEGNQDYKIIERKTDHQLQLSFYRGETIGNRVQAR